MSDEAEVTTKAAKPKKSAKKRASKLKKPKRAVSNDSSIAKGKPWTFPKNTLEDAIRIPKEIEEKNAGNPMPHNGPGYRSRIQTSKRLEISRSCQVSGPIRIG